jgi:hypothetical protein
VTHYIGTLYCQQISAPGSNDLTLLANNGTIDVSGNAYILTAGSITETASGLFTIASNNNGINLTTGAITWQFTSTALIPSSAGLDLGSATDNFGTIYYATLTQISDKDAKKDIEDLQIGLEFVNKMKPKYYKYINDEIETGRFGFIAQETKEIIDAYYPNQHTGAYRDKQNENEHMSLNYIELIAPLYKAIQELYEENKKLKEYILYGTGDIITK